LEINGQYRFFFFVFFVFFLDCFLREEIGAMLRAQTMAVLETLTRIPKWQMGSSQH